jgi:crotonobetainyl-CoA:carnitine CoA-transferase CaiB-like acyl-CoA transferase
VEAITKTRPVAHWIAILNAAGIPCGPVNRIDEVFADPQVRHAGIAKTVAHPRLGKLTLVGQPIEMSGADAKLRSAAPDLGEHSRAVLAEYGFAAAEIDALFAGGIVA